MNRVDAIEVEVAKLSRAELVAFRAWFAEFDSDQWDLDLEQDIQAGKLDELASTALREHEAGLSVKL